MSDSLKSRLRKLPLNKKLILIGAFVTAISVFLPWYSDIDQFGSGDVFLGITGPLYLAGLIVLLASAISFGIITLTMFDKPLPKLPLEKDHFYLLNSGLSIFMLVLALSVFFHHKFGYSFPDKSVGVGIILAFIGSFSTMIGAISAVKKRAVNFEEKGTLTPLISVEERERSRNTFVSKKNKDEAIKDSIEVKNAVQESIDSFTEWKSDTKDIHINDR
jgi:predicted membrane protein